MENAIHYFWPPDDKGIEFMKDTLGFDIEPRSENIVILNFNFGFVKIPFFSWPARSCIIVFTTSTKRRTFHSLKKYVPVLNPHLIKEENGPTTLLQAVLEC